MKYLAITFISTFSFAFMNCGGDEDVTEKAENESVVAKNQNRNNTLTSLSFNEVFNFDKDSCDKDSTSDWTNFLGVPYGMTEKYMDSVLQNRTGGRYSEDTANFVWFYKGIERVPVTIWTNSRTTQVETVFIEVTSSVQYFEADIDSAIVEYNLPECDTRWLGMQPKEVQALMGPADEQETLKDNEELDIISLVYDIFNKETEQLQTIVNFRFFESQDFKCSMIIVTWFY